MKSLQSFDIEFKVHFIQLEKQFVQLSFDEMFSKINVITKIIKISREQGQSKTFHRIMIEKPITLKIE